ncbi:MAG: hypothetical protein R2712_30940 [Vicinamibacterales bacterium]
MRKTTASWREILVLACGSGADVALVQRPLVRRDVQIVLLDQDHDALAFAMARPRPCATAWRPSAGTC